MKKEEFVGDWLFRYTGCALDEFGKYILLCNFSSYVRLFSDTYGVPIRGEDRPMSCATFNDITIINFGIGSPSAATIIDLLTAISPSCVVFLGKCGSVKPKVKTGDYILPIAGIRGEGTSDSYLPPEVPALPAFALQRTISSAIKEKERDYWTGTVFTTNRRVWEHDDQFREYLKKIRAMAVDMETATIFSVCFHNEIVAGSLLLVSDQPLYSEGIKTSSSDKTVDRNYLEEHLSIGILAIQKLMGDSRTLKHLKF